MEKLIKSIQKNKMTKRQIALEAGIDTSIIYNIVNGKKKDITFSTACKLADALGVKVDDLRGK